VSYLKAGFVEGAKAAAEATQAAKVKAVFMVATTIQQQLQNCNHKCHRRRRILMVVLLARV